MACQPARKWFPHPTVAAPRPASPTQGALLWAAPSRQPVALASLGPRSSEDPHVCRLSVGCLAHLNFS